VLVQGLSDPLQAVREVAFRASSALCAQFAGTHATVLLPSLEKGLFAKDWRARQAGVQLTGITLEHLMRSARGANKDNLLESQVPLTQERRSYMLAMLYIVRSDTNQSVNQNAQSVWKNVVANTPRTLRLILPILVRLIISNLSADETRQILAGRCLGDLVSKLGDRVLPDLMPILIENMHSEDASVRAGVCIGLSDIANAANRQLLQEYFSIMFPAIRSALCDSVLSVRTRASETIAGLFKELGNTAIHNVFPQILDQLNDNIDAANGIEQLLIPLHKELLAPVVEALTVIPADLNRIKALEKVSVVPQLELAKFASKIVTFFMDAYSEFPDDVLHASNVLFGTFNRHSSHLALIELTRGLGGGSDKDSSGKLREASAFLLGSCVKCVASLDVLAEYMDTLVPVLIRITLSDVYQPAMEAALHAVSELVNKITKESMIRYMDLICATVRDVKSRPGLALPKTFESLWPIYQQALMFGNPEVREAAAKGLVLLIESTPNERLKPNAIKVTGPLIRVLGERYPANIRVALLKSLQVLLQRLDSALKPFLPQLQTTYQKCAQDPDDSVKLLAEESQSLLAKMTAKNA
jgi:HEAT repeat protein